MTISFSSSNLRDDATSGNGDYRLPLARSMRQT